ncbi:hypothetical protein [Ileibacterium valens]|uniref:hypothetical protein n=1 Tax=Ileibacterium valens TaxID=1862668 RepID=UPI00272AE548|nr:hypothetical protein [Ileibacterium valens]
MNQNIKQFSADDNNFKLDDYYGSHMVFQRDQKQPICGAGRDQSEIKVTLKQNGKTIQEHSVLTKQGR